MANQPIIAAGAASPDLNQLAMLNAGYGPQTAAAAQRSQDLAQALAGVRASTQDLRTSDASVDDRLAEALMQRRYGESMQDFAQSSPSRLDQPGGGQSEASAPAVVYGPTYGAPPGLYATTFDGPIPSQQAGVPQDGEVNIDGLIANQGMAWQPSSKGGGNVNFGQTRGGAGTSGATQPEWGAEQTKQSQPSPFPPQLTAAYTASDPSGLSRNVASDFSHSSQLAMNSSGGSGNRRPPNRDDPWLDQEAETDYDICRSLPDKEIRARCFRSAAARDAARRSGRPLPSLVTERNNDGKAAAAAVGVGAGAMGLYWLVSELSRLFPPRNLVPVP